MEPPCVISGATATPSSLRENAEMRKAVEDVCASLGYRAPIICTPEELLGE